MENVLINIYINRLKSLSGEDKSGMPVNVKNNSAAPKYTIDPKLKQDVVTISTTAHKIVDKVNYIDSLTKNNPVMQGVLSALPTTRHIMSSEENSEDNPIKAIILGIFSAVMAKEDIRDALSIIGRSKSEAPKGYFAKYKFLAGTPIETWLEKRQWGKDFLDKFDETLADTTSGKKIKSFFNIKSDLKYYPKETKFPFCKPERLNREYIKLEGSFIGRLACLTMNRITKLGLIFMALLEIPQIYKATKKNKDYSQIPKSAVNVVSSVACGAIGSALLSLTIGHPAASVIGLGLGLFAGNKLSKFICQSN